MVTPRCKYRRPDELSLRLYPKPIPDTNTKLNSNPNRRHAPTGDQTLLPSSLFHTLCGVEYTYGTPMSVLPSFAERKR